MSEGTAGMPDDYGKMIEEVFIDPIRTCVVVDDEFPTLEALLDKEMGNPGKSWKPENMKQAREIIGLCRDEKHRWMVEIHDGPQPAAEGKVASHLHQSDLMILDFHLDKKRPDDGSNAIGILRELADNDHFNLVVVYTQGDQEAGGDIARVVREIGIGLCSPDTRLTMHEKSQTAIKALLEEWEDIQRKISEKIAEEIDDGVFLMARTQFPDDIDWNVVCAWPELQGLTALIGEAPEPIRSKLKLKQLAKWALHQRQQTLAPKLARQEYDNVGSMHDSLTGTNWIRTDRLFVTVVSKTNKPALLPEKLLAALRLWEPEPHRLLMSKMRAELDERGVVAEGEVLSNRCLQAGWLEEFLTTAADQRAWKVKNTVNRHWEGLGDSIRTDVMVFAERLADRLIADGREIALNKWYPSLDAAEVKSHINRYSSSKPTVERGHLTTGHVFRFENGNGGGLYWLCLSPACDLVPGQKNSGWAGRLGNHIPFIAAELFESKREKALSSAFGGNHLFLEIDGDLKCFSFTPPPIEKGGEEGMRTPNPKWEQMFAANQGRFAAADKTVVIARASGGAEGIQFNTANACVVAQLRYEYALNLLQRLGASLTRVGLDFVGMPAIAQGDGQADT